MCKYMCMCMYTYCSFQGFGSGDLHLPVLQWDTSGGTTHEPLILEGGYSAWYLSYGPWCVGQKRGLVVAPAPSAVLNNPSCPPGDGTKTGGVNSAASCTS